MLIVISYPQLMYIFLEFNFLINNIPVAKKHQNAGAKAPVY